MNEKLNELLQHLEEADTALIEANSSLEIAALDYHAVSMIDKYLYNAQDQIYTLINYVKGLLK
jgi:hypothetical protein